MYRPFRIDLQKFILDMLPPRKRFQRRVEFAYWFLRPLYRWYRQVLQPSYDRMMYELDFNSQVIKLQWLLNDQFDPAGEGITVVTNLDKSRLFIYPHISSKPKFYAYNRWKDDVTYPLNYKVTEDSVVYRSKVSNINFQPSANPSKWENLGPVTYVRNEGYYQVTPDYFINVPSALEADLEQIRSLASKYTFSGISFEIIEI